MPIGGGLEERRSRQKDNNLISVSSLDAQGPLSTQTKSHGHRVLRALETKDGTTWFFTNGLFQSYEVQQNPVLFGFIVDKSRL